jgi:hypothetical protein
MAPVSAPEDEGDSRRRGPRFVERTLSGTLTRQNAALLRKNRDLATRLRDVLGEQRRMYGSLDAFTADVAFAAASLVDGKSRSESSSSSAVSEERTKKEAELEFGAVCSVASGVGEIVSWAAIVSVGADGAKVRTSGCMGAASVGEAAYVALLSGLQTCRQQGATRVRVHGDCVGFVFDEKYGDVAAGFHDVSFLSTPPIAMTAVYTLARQAAQHFINTRKVRDSGAVP